MLPLSHQSTGHALEELLLLALPSVISPLDRVVDLLPMHDNVVGGLDSDPHLIAANLHNGDDNLVTYHDALIAMS